MREAIIHFWPEAAGSKPAMSDFADDPFLHADRLASMQADRCRRGFMWGKAGPIYL